MLAAVLFYGFLFVSLIAVPSVLLGGVLLFIEQERIWWSRVRPIAAPAFGRVANSRLAGTLRNRYPRVLTAIARRFDRESPLPSASRPCHSESFGARR
jgi:hypothetical protein